MIKFSRPLYDRVVEQACNKDEEEVCGILGGAYGEDQSIVESVYTAENVANTPKIRYSIGPKEQLELMKTIEAAGERVVGFYHSHPTGPTQPTEIDAEQAAWPEYSYVIVSLDGYPYVSSWRWREDDGFEQELLQVSTETNDYGSGPHIDSASADHSDT